MSLTPLISVIMPVFNGSEFLNESIISILNQTYTDLEFLIINDGSTDNSEDIILSFNDPRIRYFKNSQNSGIVKTLNRAIDLSMGSYIARMDADDIALPTRLEKQITFLINYPTIVVCGSQAQQIDRDGKVTGLIRCPTDLKKIKIDHLFNNVFIHPTTFFKSDILKLYKYTEDYENAEDYFLFAQLANNHQVANLSEVLLSYRVHETNITTTNYQKMVVSREKVHNYQLHNLLEDKPEGNLVNILESISVSHYSEYNIKTYEDFFQRLLKANQLTKRYDQEAFNKVITEIWFKILLLKSGRKIFTDYFNSKIFLWSTVTARHIRKVFKFTLRGY